VVVAEPAAHRGPHGQSPLRRKRQGAFGADQRPVCEQLKSVAHKPPLVGPPRARYAPEPDLRLARVAWLGDERVKRHGKKCRVEVLGEGPLAPKLAGQAAEGGRKWFLQMNYFVTGATGFIGRNLVELLLEREGTIYVLVREGSRGRLEELRNRWGASEERIVPIVGDLSQRRLGVSDDDVQRLRGRIDHLFHLAAIYDMTADAESQHVANVEGTQHMVDLAHAVEAGCVHQVSSIAAAGLYKGMWREDMFDEAENLDTHPYFRTKHESERVVREECERPWRVYRPGIVVGNSETGEIDKVDGPYYFFKLIRRMRRAVPQWVPMPGVEGRRINIVPVDYVVRAMDHIAHTDGLDGRAFHLTDPNPLTAGEVIDVFARAANAPDSSVRLPAGAIDTLRPLLRLGMSTLPFADFLTDRALADFGIPRSVLVYINYPTDFDSRRTQAALEGTGISVPPLSSYADRLWDYWERHLDPDLFTDRTLVGAARGRMGLLSGLGQVLEHQIPDELMRLGRRLQGSVSLEKVVRGRIVMVTGASSGIGKSAALKIAEDGGIVLLVARTPEKLEATKEQIESAGGVAHIHQCDLSDMDDIDRMADEVLEQHGHVDILVNNAGRSIRRSIALSYDRFHDFERTMQLNYFGAVRLILKLLPAMRERKSGQIINVSSIGVQTNTPRFSAYVASKAALDAFSRCIASEIVDDNVNVTAIYMPLVRTPMIAPTKMYQRFPTITPDEAADMVCEAIIHKPKRIATPVGTLGQILYAINPKSMDYILNSAYHLFPDSRAAKGERKREPGERPTADEQASNEQVAFAYLMRGVHW
jgi:NAD(P)-dependent dehydrogenase (short-subunit alcohol dehydrogenase family)